MTAQIEICEIGRSAPPPVMYPVPDDCNPIKALEAELKRYQSQRALISRVYGTQNTFVVMRTDQPYNRPVLRVRIVEVGIEDTQEIVIGSNDVGTEEYSK